MKEVAFYLWVVHIALGQWLREAGGDQQRCNSRLYVSLRYLEK